MNFLEAHREDYVSGQDLADQLGVSRAAVWKAIETLRSQGYTIEAKPKKGYRLLGDFDRLSQGGIRKHLPELMWSWLKNRSRGGDDGARALPLPSTRASI